MNELTLLLRKRRSGKSFAELIRSVKGQKPKISRQTLWYYESGKLKIPEDKLQAVAGYYNIPEKELDGFYALWAKEELQGQTCDSEMFSKVFWYEIMGTGRLPGTLYVLAGLRPKVSSPQLIQYLSKFLDKHKENQLIYYYLDREEDVSELFRQSKKVQTQDPKKILRIWPRVDERILKSIKDTIHHHLDNKKRLKNLKLKKIKFVSFWANDNENISPVLLLNLFYPLTIVSIFVSDKAIFRLTPIAYLYVETDINIYQWLRLSPENARGILDCIEVLDRDHNDCVIDDSKEIS